MAILMFATTGAFRTAAALNDAPPAIEIKISGDQAKGACCKTYKIHKDAVHAACSLPLAVVNETQLAVSEKSSERLSISSFARLYGLSSDPEMRPPRYH